MCPAMEDRQKAFEAKYQNDQQLQFKVQVKTSKLFGFWAADKLGIVGPEAELYADEVVDADFEEPGFEDVLRKVNDDFSAKGVVVEDTEMRKVLDQKLAEAKEALMAE
tara:strand:+ start:655 stop:978 length:324 start_codon:yes stop_codon:yes gene_type:complete